MVKELDFAGKSSRFEEQEELEILERQKKHKAEQMKLGKGEVEASPSESAELQKQGYQVIAVYPKINNGFPVLTHKLKEPKQNA